MPPTTHTAVAVSRERYVTDSPDRSWYTVTIHGPRGATYEVRLVHRPSFPRPLPYQTMRIGRTTRPIGAASYDQRRAIEDAAREAIVR